MTKVIAISVIALTILLAGTAVVYAQAADDTALRQMPMWGETTGTDGAAATSNFDEMVEVCLTASGIDPAQAQEHMQNMEEHMSDGTMEEHMQDGTCEENMGNMGNREEVQQQMEEHMADGTYEDHMGGGAYEDEDHMDGGSNEGQAGTGRMGM